MSSNSKEKFKSKIGGQALIEGVMMRGIDKAAMACRLPNGEIEVEEWGVKGGKNAPWYKKAPFIRGSVNFVISLVDGYKCLSKSAEKQGEFEEEELSNFEKKLLKIFGDKLMPILTVFSIIIGIAICFGLFMFLPMLSSLEGLNVSSSSWARRAEETNRKSSSDSSLFILNIFCFIRVS